ncbi:MAG TPA: DMSO/selenate family reductase complex A subunit [Anaerolineales bacterium]|nr:DMSO/selenate family reductase complex A subunit [Anaerolineales bacterium]
MTEPNFLAKALTETAITRRSFLKWSAALGGTAALAGGMNYGLKAVKEAAAQSVEELKTVGCYHNCGGRCILGAVVKDGTVVRLVPDPTPKSEENLDSNPRAIPCLRGRSQIHRVYAPERLKYPMKRVGKRGEGKFERISWDEALNTIADQMKRIKDKYGNEAFYYQYASGSNWNGPDSGNAVTRLLAMFGGFVNMYGSYSEAAYGQIIGFSTSGYSGNSADDIPNAKLVVLIGDNSVVTRAGGDNAGYWVMKAANQGTKFIIIDPIMTDTVMATQAQWVPINGGTDVALLAAMAHVMIKENLYDKEFMATHAVGFDEDTLPEGAPANSSWVSYVMGRGPDGIEKTPEWASPITGIPAETIASLARQIATTKPCAIYQNWGVQRRAYGEQIVRTVPIIAAMTGNFGISGGNSGNVMNGGYFPMSGIPVPENPVKASIPCFLWPDFVSRGEQMTSALEEGGVRGVDKLSTGMKFMWNHAGNMIINQHADVNLTTKILQDESKLEFIVTSEVAMTPSCKFSDILLPETTGFEADEIITGEGHGMKGNHAWALYNHQIIQPLYECKGIMWAAGQLADRLGFGDQFRDGHQTSDDWMKDMVATAQQAIPDFPSLDDFKKTGIYKISNPEPIIAFADFRADPVAHPLQTETGKLEIYSPALAKLNNPKEIPAIPMYIPEWEGVSDPLREKYPLMMMTTHFVARSHSTFENVDYLREAHPQALWINVRDAEQRGIKNGDMIKVYNDRGEVHLPAYVTNRIRPGVTNMPQGAWYSLDANGVDVRGCGNVLTNYRPTPYARGCTAHTNLVQVEKL